MNGTHSPTSQSLHAAHNRQQTLLVRAVVGSLVLCAALGTPAAAVQFHAPHAPRNASLTARQFRPFNAAHLADVYNAFVRIERIERRGHIPCVEILNHMARNANGKQLTMRLEMSREQAGNLLRQHLALP